MLAVLLSGCKTPESNIQLSADTLYVFSHTRDSIYLKDSIYTTEKTIRDTVYITKNHWRTKYKTHMERDTIYHHKVDSVEIITKIEPTFIEKAKYASLWIVVGMIVMLFILIFSRRGV